MIHYVATYLKHCKNVLYIGSMGTGQNGHIPKAPFYYFQNKTSYVHTALVHSIWPRHCENYLALTGWRMDFGLILLMLLYTGVLQVLHVFLSAMQGLVTRSRTTLKFWSATMLGAAARNFGPVHKFELPTVIADSVPRATRVFSLASVGHVTGHMVSHMVPIGRCRPPYWKIFTVNNLATVF